METTKKIAIYLAKDLEELNNRVTDTDAIRKVKNAASKAIGNMMEVTWAEAKKAEDQQDEERAYILYMRLFECLKLMQETKDAASNQPTIKYYQKAALIWLEKAEIISKSLQARYEEIRAETMAEECKKQAEIDEENSLVSSIRARQLYKYMNHVKRNILLIDMRSKVNYNQSHMRTQTCIHIPPDLMAGKGWTSWAIEAALTDETTKTLFKNRANYDYIVLFNEGDYEADLKMGHPLLGLKCAIFSLDKEVQLKHEPLILEGGYQDWMVYYPGESTAPLPTLTSAEGLATFERAYPEDIQEEEKATVEIPPPVITEPVKIPVPNIDRTRKPIASQQPEPFTVTDESRSKISSTEDEPVLPMVQPSIPDRSIKPPTLIKSESPLEQDPVSNSTTSVDIPSRPTTMKPVPTDSESRTEGTPKAPASNLQADKIENNRENLPPTNTPSIVLPPREQLSIYRPFNQPTSIRDVNPQYKMKLDATTGRKVFVDTNTNQFVNSVPIGQRNGTVASPQIIPTVNRDIKPVLTELNRRQIAIDYRAITAPLQINRRTGLKNLGNSCYMNAVIQALSFNLSFTNYFLSGEFNKSINTNNRFGSGGLVVREWFRLMYALWSQQNSSIAPYPFKHTVGSLQHAYLGTQQQDAHEFLVFLLDSLHEDLNQAPRPPTEELKSENYKDDRQFAEATKNAFRLHNKSIVIDLFYGLFKSTTICLSCQYGSHRFEAFAMISVPIPRVRQSSLEECLDLFREYEYLRGDERYLCSKCKQISEKRRRLDIWELPQIFIVHFKRFRLQQNHYIKNETLIRYKTLGMDFSRWSQLPNKSRYSLISVINHYGSMNSGHYTAYCNDGKSWYYCDDETIRPADSRELETNAYAYLLFYSSLPQPTLRLPIISN